MNKEAKRDVLTNLRFESRVTAPTRSALETLVYFKPCRTDGQNIAGSGLLATTNLL